MKIKGNIILIICILICLVMTLLCVSSCSLFSNTNSEPTEEELEARAKENVEWLTAGPYVVVDSDTVRYVDKDGKRWNWGNIFTLYDKETKVMYMYTMSFREGGGLVMLVNPDGTPKLYKE